MVEEEGHVDEPLAVDSYQVCCVPNCHGLPGFAGQPHTFLVHRRSHSSLKAKAYFILDVAEMLVEEGVCGGGYNKESTVDKTVPDRL